jgi:hypothetical protein
MESDLRKPDLILSGTVLRLGEYSDRGRRWAEVSLQLHLADGTTGETLWTATKEKKRDADPRRFEAVVAGLSALLADIVQESVSEMRTALGGR